MSAVYAVAASADVALHGFSLPTEGHGWAEICSDGLFQQGKLGVAICLLAIKRGESS